MFLQKTGWRIKQIISHRQYGSPDDDDDDDITKHCQGRSNSTADLASSSRLSHITTECCSAFNRACISTDPVRSISPPLPDAMAYSSASSLSTCKYGASTHLAAASLFNLSPAPPSPRVLYLPHLNAPETFGDSKTWQLTFSDTIAQSWASSSPDIDLEPLPAPIYAPKDAFNLIEALMIDPMEAGDKTPTRSIRNTQDFDLEKFSGGVDQLIKEKADFIEAPSGMSGKGGIMTVIHSEKTHTSDSNTMVAAKRHPFHREISKQPVRVGSRRAPRRRMKPFATNLIEVINGRMFKMEVDEMLTPSRVQRIKSEKEYSTLAKSDNWDCIDGEDSTIRFHVDNLSTSIHASRQLPISPYPSPVLPPPPIPAKSAARRSKRNMKAGSGIMVVADLKLPSRAQKYSRSGNRKQLQLSTIPETSSLLPQTQSCTTTMIANDSKLVILRSTSFTLTSPLIRHGPIHIRHREVNKPNDEALDWTAFQMAILCTMNENEDEDEWRLFGDETDEITRITKWFAEFGFDGPGALVHEAQKHPKMEVYVKDNADWKTSWGRVIDGRGTWRETDWKNSQIWGVRLEEGINGESMLPSPMPYLMPTKAEPILPMGYNLGNDLGDFLNREAQLFQSLHDHI